MRLWARFGLVVGLCTALLAAYGAAFVLHWQRLTKQVRIGIISMLLAGIIFEFTTVPYPFGLSHISLQPLDDWLRQQPGDIAVLMLPPDKTWHGPPLYAARVHGKKIAYGYGTYMPKAYRAWQERVAAFPDGDSINAIKEAGIRYILVGLRSYGDQEQTMRQKLATDKRLHLEYTVEEQPVFRGDRLIAQVRPSPAVPPTELVGTVRYAYLVDEIAVYEIAE